MKQAALLNGKANATMQASKGAFDPKLYGEYENKSFDQKNYFKKGEGGLKIPTWIGADFKLGYAWSNGQFLNSENSLPPNGQAIIGAEIPLAKGLFFDQRRAQIQMAKLLSEKNEAERKIIVNDLLMEAIAAYWQWAFQDQRVQVYTKAYQLAENRYEMIRQSFLQGDKPAIDTLESLIQVQNRALILSKALTDFENASLSLSNFLWTPDLYPLEITPLFRPETLRTEWTLPVQGRASIMNNSWLVSHPELQIIKIKQDQLQVKERLKKEDLKPLLNLNYNFLADGFDFSSNKSDDNNLQAFLQENYKWGLELSYPLFLRKARGSLELVQLEQLDTEYKFQSKQLDLQNKTQIVVQQFDLVEAQISTQTNVLQNYQILLAAENEKFRIGESSIFMLNSREQKLFESELKLAKLQAEYQKLRRKLDWVRGMLN